MISRTDQVASDPFEQAVRQAEDAVRDNETAEAHRHLGGLYYVDDRFEEAQQQWEIAFRLFRANGDNRHAARTAMDVAGLHISAHGHLAAGSGWIERARLALDGVGPCVEWGYLELAVMACDRTDIDELLDGANRALLIALEFHDADLEAQALADGGLALVTRGRVKEGMARLDAALAAISAGEVSPIAGGIAFCSMLTACDRTGDVRRAQEWTAIVTDMIRGHGNRPRVLHTHCRIAYGSVLCAAGRWPEAEALMVDALGPSESPTVGHRALTLGHLAELRIQQGRIDEAAELLAPFEDRISSCAPLAQIHLRRGQPDLAAAVLHRGLKELHNDALRISPLLSLLVEAELERGDRDAARAAVERLDALAGEAAITPVLVDKHVSRARLLADEGDGGSASADLERAIALLDSDQRPMLVATIRLDLAEVLARLGESAMAITEARAALSCFQRLGAAPRRDRAAALLRGLGDTGRTRPQRPDDVAGTLSVREQEVLDLVRQGLSNAEIGSRLFISPKTAEHHVSRILTKLGVRSRGEAAAMAVRLAAISDN
ncbi:MAG TPA: LuxR C-terminal-related transcriptional regulator [Ilumatobacteraceae bacterium]|nr:LuxR C-terminal-related transcriptional regulator [Ilumatobacteraceae bacterium]